MEKQDNPIKIPFPLTLVYSPISILLSAERKVIIIEQQGIF